MDGFLDLAIDNLGSPLILSFMLGLAAALARSDLSFPEAAAKALSIYLLFAIGFKGGVSVSRYGIDWAWFNALAGGRFMFSSTTSPWRRISSMFLSRFSRVENFAQDGGRILPAPQAEFECQVLRAEFPVETRQTANNRIPGSIRC